MTASCVRHKQTVAAAPTADFSSLLSAHQREVLAQERTVMLSLHESLLAMGTDPKELLVLRKLAEKGRARPPRARLAMAPTGLFGRDGLLPDVLFWKVLAYL